MRVGASRRALAQLARLALAACALALAALFPACGRAPGQSPAAPDPAPPAGPAFVELTDAALANADVRSTRLSPTAFTPRLSVQATVVADPRRIARVGPRVAGRVLEVRVALGDQVVAGQALVDIDTVELHQVATEFLTASARARQAADVLARQRQLSAERIGATVDLRRAEADASAASAALQEAEEHLHILGLSDRDIARIRSRTSHGEAHSTLRAPIAGRISAMNVALGQVVSGTEELLVIAQIDTVWASMRLYERDVALVRQGEPVAVAVPAYPGREFPGTVSFVGDVVDPISRTLEARAELSNPDGALRPGMAATALLLLPARGEQLWIPREAVQPHEGEPAVFVRAGPRKFEVRPVRVGDEQGGFVPVISGVSAGDDVVTHGAFALRGELERAEIEGEE